METPTKTLTLVLSDINGDGKDLEVTVEYNSLGLLIKPKGFGDNGSAPGFGCPLLVENRGGVPFVCVWDDINQEDASHVISLEKAAEGKYEEKIDPDVCTHCGKRNTKLLDGAEHECYDCGRTYPGIPG